MQTSLAALARLAEKEKKDLYIVGGFVRDALRGLESRDVDLTISEEAEQFAKRAAWILRAEYELLDSHSQYSRLIMTGPDGKPFSFDISLQQGGCIENDLLQRDFSVNAIAVRLTDYLQGDGWQEKVKDPCGGVQDLQDRVLRLTSPQCLEADPVRLFRAARFCLRLDYSLAPETRDALRNKAGLIKRAQKMKLALEMFQLLSQVYAAEGMAMLHDLDILPQFFPAFGRMSVTLEEGEDLFVHSLTVCRSLNTILGNESHMPPQIREKLHAHLRKPLQDGERPKLAYLRLACLLHDVGKVDGIRSGAPTCKSFNHEIAGEIYLCSLARQLCLSEKEQSYLERLVCNHSRPSYLLAESQGSVLRFFRQFHDIAPELLLLSAANAAARYGTSCRQAMEIGNLLTPYFDGAYSSLPEPMVSAQDIMQFFNLPPVRAVGGFLENVYAAQVDGRIRSKGDALAWVSRLLESRTR